MILYFELLWTYDVKEGCVEEKTDVGSISEGLEIMTNPSTMELLLSLNLEQLQLLDRDKTVPVSPVHMEGICILSQDDLRQWHKGW